MQKFWQFKASVNGGAELVLDGPISSTTWFGDEVTPKAFKHELKQFAGQKVTVVINSPGGDVFAGVSIYNALREHDASVDVRVVGLAASAASLIAMVGEKITMAPGSMMMIHNPWTSAIGDSKEMLKTADVLDSIRDAFLSIYTTRSGKSEEDVKQLLDDETWMTASEAVEMGFADEEVEAVGPSVKDALKNALMGDMAVAYNMSATKVALEDLATKLEAQDDSELTEPEADANEADNAEKTAEEEVVETPDAEPISTEKETPEMTEEEKLAAAAQIEVAKPAPTISATAELKDYLASNQAMEDFAQVLVANAGKSGEEVHQAWKAELHVKMGVTNPEVFLPASVITAIEDAFKEGGEIWNLVNKTGLDVFNTAWDSATGADTRARGYRRSEAEAKAEEVITLSQRTLRPQFVYKYITLNKEDVKNQRSTGALVRYVLTELPHRIIREIERAIVIEDGRADNDDYKIVEGNPNGFYSIKADAAAENFFAARYVPEAGESHYSALLHARDLLKGEGAVYLIAKKGYVTSMLLEQSVSGGFMFPVGSNIPGLLGFAGLIEPDWLDDTTDTTNDAYLVRLNNYRVVGDQSIEAFTNFTLNTNKQEYLQEIWAGGGLSGQKVAVAIAVTPES